MPRLIMLACWLGFAAIGAGNTFRVAVIDMGEAFKAHPEAAKAEAALMKQRAEAGKAFNKKADELKKLLEDHQELTRNLIESGERATETQKSEARELLGRASELEREIAAIRTTQERDLQQAFVAERRRILESITKVVGEFNGDGRYAMIFDRSAESANGIPQVIHASGAEEITADIIKLLKETK